MTSNLSDYLKQHIAAHGPIDMAQFMSMALGHPKHGYYMKQDPFGRGGDFTTAPEISQIFGEVIGAWVADIWLQMGQPTPFTLLECGPGRGTLMADIMRATADVEGFHEACRIHLLETSPVLKDVQSANLAAYKPQFHEALASVPEDVPVIMLANEFLDALPVRQLQKTDEGWQERVVCLDKNQDFSFSLQSSLPKDLEGVFPVHIERSAKPGDIFEISLARLFFMRNLCALLRRSGGAALFIDYGHLQSGLGDTLQAVYKHEYISVLDHIGDADLTAHVDFEVVHDVVQKEDVVVWGPLEQGSFLKAIGIEQRAQYLMGQATESQQEDIQKSLHRLTHSDQMGALFKVMGLSYGDGLKPAGF